jgi:hypothetical protein
VRAFVLWVVLAVLSSVLAWVIITSSACKLPPPAAAVPDASTAQATCANLARLGCAIGADPECVSRLERAVSESHATIDVLDCGRTAASKAAVSACGPYLACP